MPVSMYDPDGQWCPVDNVLVATRLAEGYTLEDPAVVNADIEEREAEHERQVKSNQEMLDELLGNEPVPEAAPAVVDVEEEENDEPEPEVDE